MDLFGLHFRKSNFNTLRTNLRFGFWNFVAIFGIYVTLRPIAVEEIGIKQILVNVCHVGGILMGALRFIHLYFDHKRFSELIDDVIESVAEFKLNPTLEKQLSDKYVRKSRLVQLSLYITFRFVIACNAYLPAVFIKWYMLCPISIPGINIHSHPGYEFALLFYLFLYYYFSAALHFYDTYYYSFSIFIAMKSSLFCTLASKLGDYKSDYNTNDEQKRLLYDLCVLHQEINKFTVKCSKTFAVIVLGTGIISLFFLTIAIYIRYADPFYAFTLVSVTTTQFFLLCFFGELVLEQSNKMFRAIYFSLWYNIHNIKDRETIVFLLQHTQRYVRFSAYGMYDLSMETFFGFVQKAYSFYALLRKMS